MTLHDALTQLRREWGTDAQAARAYGITKGQWNKLKNWRVMPTPATLEKLGLEAVTSYRWRKET